MKPNQPEIEAAKDIARNPYAWPGGYPKFLVTSDGGCLCKKCVRDHFRTIARDTRDGNTSSGWSASGAQINWEDTALTCDHCGEPIEAAYA